MDELGVSFIPTRRFYRMKNVFLNFFIVMISCISLIACSTNTRNENTAIGAVSGGVIGGLAGSAIGGGTGKIIAVGAGAIVGALLGGYVGSSMDSSDTTKTYNTLNNNPSNKSSRWKNQNTGTTYTVTPMSEPMATKGYSYCRDFSTTAIISGKKQKVTGTACRQSDGTWKAV